MTAAALAPSPSPLVELLEETAHALVRLHAATIQVRGAELPPAGDGPAFLPAELERLCTLIHGGWDSVCHRLHDLSRAKEKFPVMDDGEAEFAAGAHSSGREAGEPDSLRPHSLLATYRASCRALCAALQEARRVSDATTAALLSGVLQRLEKQLWLLDSSREHPRFGLPTIELFLSC